MLISDLPALLSHSVIGHLLFFFLLFISGWPITDEWKELDGLACVSEWWTEEKGTYGPQLFSFKTADRPFGLSPWPRILLFLLSIPHSVFSFRFHGPGLGGFIQKERKKKEQMNPPPLGPKSELREDRRALYNMSWWRSLCWVGSQPCIGAKPSGCPTQPKGAHKRHVT